MNNIFNKSNQTKQCSICKQWKPIIEYHKHKNQKWGIHSECKECSKKQNKKIINKYKEKGICLDCFKNPISKTDKNRCETCRKLNNKRTKILRNKLKIRIIQYYTKGTMKCQGYDGIKCPWNVSDIDVLTIDHIDGGGYKHRKELNGHVNSWLLKNKFPEGYQILCMNCQLKKKIKNKEY